MRQSPVEARSIPPQEGEPGRYDAFLSYAREDRAFAERLVEALAARGQRVWLDVRDIPGGAQWRLHQAQALEACKAFVFLLSSDSVSSQNCREELEQAEALNKLVIPVSHREVDQRELPSGLADPEWVFLREGDRLENGVEKLTEALHVDHDWRQQHTRLAMRAREWEEAGEDKSFLLRGSDLANAESWLTEQAGHREAPTARHADFIVRGRQAARVRQRRVTMAFGLAFLLAIGLAAFALDQRSAALDQKHAALSRALAVQAREVARTDIDTGALLALEAYRLEQTIEARDALLSFVPDLQRTGPVFADEVPEGAGLGFDPESGDIYLSEAGEIRWFDPGSGEPGRREQVPAAKEMSLLPSPDGRTFAYGATAADVSLWDRNREVEVARLHDPGGAIPAYEMLFSPDSETIAVVQEASVRLWDLESERFVELVPPLRDNFAYMSQATAFSPDSRLIAAGAANGCIYIWEVAGGKLTRPGLCGDRQPVTSLAFSHAGDRLVAGEEDGEVRIWNLVGKARQTPAPHAHRDVVAALAFSSDDERVASVGDDGVLSLWDVDSGRSVQYRIERNPGISSYSGQRAFDELAFDADGETLVTVREGEGRVWDASPDGAFGEPLGYGSEVEGDAISPNGKLIVVRKDEGAEIWDRRTDERVSLPEPGFLGGFEFSADNELVLAANESDAMVWDAGTGVLQHELEHTLDPHTIGSRPNVALSPDRRLIVTTADYADDKGEDFGVRVWRTSDGGLLESLPSGFDYAVSDVAFSPDGELLAATGVGDPFHGTIQIWDTSTWRPVARSSVRKDRLISGFVFSPNGEMLATAGERDPVRLWTVPDLRPFGRPLFGDVDAAPAIAFSPDGQTLATGGEDGRVRLWDVATQEMLGQPLPAHDELVNTLRFSSDGKELISMGSPATLRTWDSILWAADYSQLHTLICNAIGHNLSPADWEQLVPEEPYHATCS